MIIEGDRILIRRPRLSDEYDIWKCSNDKDVARYTSISLPYTKKKARKLIRRAQYYRRKKTSYIFCIVSKKLNKVMGIVTLGVIDLKSKAGSVGYWIGKNYRNKGYTTEAVKLILYFGFKRLNLHRISCSHYNGNIGSMRVIEKSGFKYEGVFRDAGLVDHVWSNISNYSILAHEYAKFRHI